MGSHVVTPRRGYLHHGIYFGGGRVVHYAGPANGLRRRPVEETTLQRFMRSRPLWVQLDAPSTFDPREIVRRARSRIGEDAYKLLSNDCGHFCEWCLRGENRSYQVEAWVLRPGIVLRATFACWRNRSRPYGAQATLHNMISSARNSSAPDRKCPVAEARPAHVADADQSEFAVFACDRIHV